MPALLRLVRLLLTLLGWPLLPRGVVLWRILSALLLLRGWLLLPLVLVTVPRSWALLGRCRARARLRCCCGGLRNLRRRCR